jgi:hypothetical protein
LLSIVYQLKIAMAYRWIDRAVVLEVPNGPGYSLYRPPIALPFRYDTNREMVCISGIEPLNLTAYGRPVVFYRQAN